MSAPRTMLPEELESVRASVWHAKQIPVDIRDTVEHDLIALDAELDAERAAFATLEQDYAQAVRALRLALEDVPGWVEHTQAVLSTPRAQAVKEVE